MTNVYHMSLFISSMTVRKTTFDFPFAPRDDENLIVLEKFKSFSHINLFNLHMEFLLVSLLLKIENSIVFSGIFHF